MNDFFNSLTTSDWINLGSTIASVLVSIIAVCISGMALHQTKKSIESANRPYLGVYASTLHIGNEQDFYLVFRNYGNSSLTISDVNCTDDFSEDFSNIDTRFRKDYILGMKGISIAPNQSISVHVNANKHKEPFKLSIAYKNVYSRKVISETYAINLLQYNPVGRQYTPNKDSADASEYLKYIIRIMQDDLRRKL